MKKLFMICALTGSSLFAFTGHAQDLAQDTRLDSHQDLRIVELFTSQGCSSCPPSNALLTDWSRSDNVLALTYSVDYWDYLGWSDSFAKPKFTERQRAYSKAIGHGRVYTPQIVINGELDKPRFTTQDVLDQSLSAKRPSITLTPSGHVTIDAFALDSTAQVRVVSFTPGTQNVSIKRGENGGRSLELTNVVTDISETTDYSGAAIELTPPSDTAYAVIIQEDNYGPVIAAAQFTP